MSRIDVYGPPHKALRLAGGQVLVALGTCAGDPAAVAQALTRLDELLVMFEIHARLEDEFIIPAIEARRPGASARLVDAHVDHALSIAELRRRRGAAERATGAAQYAVLHGLYLELSRFIADDLVHMLDEETLAQPLLHEAYADAELAELLGRARATMTPAEAAMYAPAMAAALSAPERARLGMG